MKKIYAITAIWQNTQDEVTHVMLHDATATGTPISEGLKTTTDEVVKLLNGGHSVTTALWDYEAVKWKPGAPVHVFSINPHLRTKPDAEKKNNLESLPLMNPRIKFNFFKRSTASRLALAAALERGPQFKK